MVRQNPIQLSYILENPIQLSCTNNSLETVVREMKKIFRYHYPHVSFDNLNRCISRIEKLFNGEFPGYRACNVGYHNLEHTVETTLAAVRLLDGYNTRNSILHEQLAINLIIASLFHDTGYIQEADDHEGTGAKHTLDHVKRSSIFLRNHHKAFGIEEESTDSIARLIDCTGFTTDIDSIPFKSREERITGSMLGAGDLLGQMSNRTYLEKLLFLYREFKEAGITEYQTEFDIVRKTIGFYEITKRKFIDDYMGVHKYARDHFSERFGIDENLYLTAIERNIQYLHEIIADDSTNFRHKLRRGNWRVIVRKQKGTMPSSI